MTAGGWGRLVRKGPSGAQLSVVKVGCVGGGSPQQRANIVQGAPEHSRGMPEERNQPL